MLEGVKQIVSCFFLDSLRLDFFPILDVEAKIYFIFPPSHLKFCNYISHPPPHALPPARHPDRAKDEEDDDDGSVLSLTLPLLFSNFDGLRREGLRGEVVWPGGENGGRAAYGPGGGDGVMAGASMVGPHHARRMRGEEDGRGGSTWVFAEAPRPWSSDEILERHNRGKDKGTATVEACGVGRKEEVGS